MEFIELSFLVLLAVLLSSYIVRILPFSLPLPIVQIAMGVLISSGLHAGIRLEPSTFFLLFLPPLLFLDGWRIPKDGLLRDKSTILELAFGLVIFTVIGMGYLIHWMIPSMPLAVAFALAAIISPTDPVAVSAITARIPMPKRLMHILEGESLLNDASGLVCFRFAVAAAVTGSFSLLEASVTFVWVALGGLTIGILFTFLVFAIQHWLATHVGEDRGSAVLMSLLLPFGAYLLAEEMHASGILAAVAAGVTMSYIELSGRAMASTRVQRTAAWNTIQFALNGAMFVLLGEQLPSIFDNAVATVSQSGRTNPWWLLVYVLVITTGLAVLRFVWVWVSLQLTILRTNARSKETVTAPPWRLIAVTSIPGVRGSITLAGVLTLPLVMADGSLFPSRELAIFLAASVILLSMISASIGLPFLLKKLELPEEVEHVQEEDFAWQHSATAALQAIRDTAHTHQSPEETEAYSSAAARIISVYQRRLDNSSDMDKENSEINRLSDDAERELRLVAIKAQRHSIYQLAKQKRISDQTSRKLVQQLDMLETLYS